MTTNFLHTAVLFLVFNRPQCTLKVFEAIRKAKPPRLYIACDGPRLNHIEDMEKIEKVRQTVSLIDWPCEVHTLFNEHNKGCKNAVSDAITWFFTREERGIILEDDCLPSQSFFRYCEELLDKYDSDQRIYHIDGTNFTEKESIFSADYEFSSYALIWGWATWRRAWNSYDINIEGIDSIIHKRVIKARLGSEIAESYWIKNLNKIRSGFDTWDYQWFASIWLNHGLTIRPKLNLVKNIGFDEQATHTKTSTSLYTNMEVKEIDFPLRHPNSICPNLDLDTLCSRIRFGINESKATRLLRKLGLTGR